MKIHKNRTEHTDPRALFAYAEQLEAGCVPFGSPAASHVTRCDACRDEVAMIRASLSLTDAAVALEPTDALEAGVLLALHTHRQLDRRRARRRGLRAAGVAACVLIAMSTVIGTGADGIRYVEDDPVPAPSVLPVNALELVALGPLQALSPEETVLEPALLSSSWEPETRWELAQQRALETLDRDIEEAMSALEGNAALVHAGTVIHANRELKRHTLKNLYARRNL